MEPWGWIFLGFSLFVLGLSLWAGRWSTLAAAILFFTCAASNFRHVYLDHYSPASVYAIIDLIGGLLMIEVFKCSERGKRRYLAGILALFAAMMCLHVLIWLASLFEPIRPFVRVYRLALSVLYAGQLLLAAIPGGRLAPRHIHSALRNGLRARAVQA